MTSSICILTDDTVQFPQFTFAGKENVQIIPFTIEVNGRRMSEENEVKASDLPASVENGLSPRLVAPSVASYQELFIALSNQYHNVIAILTSAGLSKSFENAQKAVIAIHGRVHVTLIDSQSISIGLGLLVQTAAESVAKKMPAAEIERLIRSLVPHTYMMLCVPGMSYLYHAGLIDQAQAVVGEMLGLMPVFTLEEGLLSPVEKIRNMRALVDFMQEFLLEFEDLTHIAFIQSYPPISHEAHAMREHAQNFFAATPFTELNINLPLALLAGPRSMGMVVLEKPGV